MTFEEEFAQLYDRMISICAANNQGNPFIGGRANEIHMANALGFKISPTLSGADAYDLNGDPVEFKSSTQDDRFHVSYGGVPLFDTWNEQHDYVEKKIKSTVAHYYGNYCNGKLQEIWKLDSDTVYTLLIDKYKGCWSRGTRPDLRVGEREINLFGELVYTGDGVLQI